MEKNKNKQNDSRELRPADSLLRLGVAYQPIRDITGFVIAVSAEKSHSDEILKRYNAYPDLLEACKSIKEYFETCAEGYVPDKNACDEHLACHAVDNSVKLQKLCNAAGDKVVAAIAKAERRGTNDD